MTTSYQVFIIIFRVSPLCFLSVFETPNTPNRATWAIRATKSYDLFITHIISDDRDPREKWIYNTVVIIIISNNTVIIIIIDFMIQSHYSYFNKLAFATEAWIVVSGWVDIEDSDNVRLVLSLMRAAQWKSSEWRVRPQPSAVI